jgi:hypothetical protein
MYYGIHDVALHSLKMCHFQFYISLALLFLLEVVGGVLAFVFSNQVKEQITKVLQEEAIIRYRDDPNLMNIMDWFQENVSKKSIRQCGTR